MDDFPPTPDRLVRACSVHSAFTASGSTIHPEAELVIIRMGSEATPLDLDRVRGWRRGFDAIAEYFL
jgi:hypothetical protein